MQEKGWVKRGLSLDSLCWICRPSPQKVNSESNQGNETDFHEMEQIPNAQGQKNPKKEKVKEQLNS